MGKYSDYKKKASVKCHYCDYCTCRKGHKCNWFKKFVKQFRKK